MKTYIDAMDYASRICKALPKGVLLTTAAEGKVNAMTIGWGHLGVEWSRPVFVAYVRKSRYTDRMLKKNAEFTVNIPLEDADPEIIRVCGRQSGRDIDKVAALGLTLEPGEKVSVPGILQMPLTLECRVLFTVEQDAEKMPAEVQQRFYPVQEDGTRDIHVAYYGEIVGAYIAKA